MTYWVVLDRRADRDLRMIFQRASRNAPTTAARWLDRFRRSLDNLKDNPHGYPLAPESDDCSREVRQLVFGKGRNIYRALFTIEADIVHVLHIRWAGRDYATPDDLFA